MSLKIGIMGGTFNPIHNGHVRLAFQAYKELQLDKVLFMPSKIPPHKLNENILSDDIRADMVKIAIKDYNYFEFSDFELKRSGITYTSETLELLTSNNKNCQYYFIMGADSLLDIEKWNRPAVVMSKAKIVVAVRDEIDYNKLNYQKEALTHKYNADIYLLNMAKVHVSSKEIRYKIKNGEDISELVSKEVSRYIFDNKLYLSQ